MAVAAAILASAGAEDSLEWDLQIRLAGSVTYAWYATINTRAEAVPDVAQK